MVSELSYIFSVLPTALSACQPSPLASSNLWRTSLNILVKWFLLTLLLKLKSSPTRKFGTLPLLTSVCWPLELASLRFLWLLLMHSGTWESATLEVFLLLLLTFTSKKSSHLQKSSHTLFSCVGLGPGTLVGSAAFDLFPIHAVCVLMPKAGELKKISDLGVWLVELVWSFWAYIWLYIILEVVFAMNIFC